MKVLFLLATFLIGYSTAIQCYKATSPNINYHPNKNYAQRCPSTTTRCFKMIADYKNHHQAIFDCERANDPMCNGVQDGVCTTLNGGVRVCCCSSDLCNSGTTLSLVTISVSILGLFLL